MNLTNKCDFQPDESIQRNDRLCFSRMSSISFPFLSNLLPPHNELWALKSPNRSTGDGN